MKLFIDELKIKANNIRNNIIKVGYKSRSAHYGGSLSCADILAYIYFAMKYTNENDRDRFILSKGHCALALYSALYEFGFISQEELLSFNSNGGNFPSHCVKNIAKGIELSSGSLGLGLSFASGQAVALKNKKIANKIYVLAGNGEINEGSFWEAVMFAGAKNLNNIILIVDSNRLQNDGISENIISISNMVEAFKSFGWESVETDGHNFEEIEKAMMTKTEKPLVVIANTIKGKGISFMENNPKWHHASLSEEEYCQALKELEGY